MSPKNDFPSLAKARDLMRSLIEGYKPSKSIKRIEIKILPVDMLSWLFLQKADVKIYGADQSDTMAIAGIGQVVCISAGRLGSFKKIFGRLRSFLSPEYPYLQWYGGFCFDDRHQDGDWQGFGAYRFVLPRFELAAREGRMIFCCNLYGRENIPEVLRQLDRMAVSNQALDSRFRGNDRYACVIPAKAGIQLKRVDNPGQELWEKNVRRILNERSVEKVVLARKTSIFFKTAPDPWAMLRQLKAVTPNSYHFAFQFGKTCFLGASPERLFRRRGREIESEALAGTMPGSSNPKELQKSAKNRHEHVLVVDAIEAAFEGFCSAFQRPKKPGILTLPNGHHLITRFQGQLKDGIKEEDILEALHPTPALGGTPRKKALDLIRRLENFSRGWYGAPVGYVGLDWAEFVVGIRSGLVKGKKLSVFAGAGIVQGSDPPSEWMEVENKISNFIKIIQ